MGGGGPYPLQGHSETKEPGTVPVRAGDQPGDGGQAGILLVPPPEPLPRHHHGMALALVFSDDLGPGLQAPNPPGIRPSLGISQVENATAFVARILLAWYFISEAVQRLDAWRDYIQLLALPHMPLSGGLFFGPAVVITIVAASGLAAGFWTRSNALILVLSVLVWTGLAHRFWEIPSSIQRDTEYQLFSLGIAVAGGLLSLVAFGGGRFSLDRMRPLPLDEARQVEMSDTAAQGPLRED